MGYPSPAGLMLPDTSGAATTIFARKGIATTPNRLHLQHRSCSSSSTPRVMRLILLVAAAVGLPSSLPTASGAAAGSGPMKAMREKRAPGSEAERKTGGWSDARRPRVGENYHDSRADLPRRRPSSRPRPGEAEGGDGGWGRRRASSSLQQRRDASAGSASARGIAADISASSSLRGEEDDDEEEGSSWDGNSSGSHDNAEDDGFDGGSSSSSCENHDTEEGLWGEGTEEEEVKVTVATPTTSDRRDESDDDGSDGSSEEHFTGSYEDDDSDQPLEDDDNDNTHEGGVPQQQQQKQQQEQQLGHRENNGENSVGVCVLTWNLAEESPPARDLEFLRHAARGSDLVAVGVQEIENLKPRRNEGGRTREWRRLLMRTLGRDFVRVGHHAMGAVQLTLFARREVLDRVKVIKLSEVVCGVGNVLQNKGGIGAYVRVDRTTFLFVAAHLAAHQGKVEDRNAGYWRIATALDQEIPPAWVTHAARKRAKRAKAAAAAAAAATAEVRKPAADDQHQSPPMPWLPGARGVALPPRGPFGDRVDRVFFFGDLNYRVDLSREDLELGVSVCRRQQAVEGKGEAKGRRIGRRFRPGVTYPGTGALDSLLDFDQLTLARSRGAAFGGFSEARVTFEPTFKYDKGSQDFDTSRKMRPPAWTDRILYSPAGPLGVSSVAYTSVPGSCHSDHRPVYAKFRVRLAD